MSSSDVKELVREELQEAYEYWMNQANTRTDGQRKEIASRLAAAEVSALYGQGEIYNEYESAVLAALAFEEAEEIEQEQEEERSDMEEDVAESDEVEEDVAESDEVEEDESEKSDQAFAEEDENEEQDPLDLVIDGENISDIKDAVRDEDLDNAELESMISAENDKGNPRTTLIDWLENQKSDEAEDDIMEIGAE